MHRIIIGFAVLLLFGCIFWFYRISLPQEDEHSRQMFDIVMAEKMQQLYEQAEHWETPITLNIHDARLSGDYKKVSEFLLNYWVQNAEARNQYIRELKQANWETFLDVDQLDHDRQQGYQETAKILAGVDLAVQHYQQHNLKIQQQAVKQAKTLTIQPQIKMALLQKLEVNKNKDREYAIFSIEQQIYSKAHQMFDLLKTHRWQKQNGKVSFYETAQVKQFNQLYQEVLQLNARIEQLKTDNAKSLQQDIRLLDAHP